MNNLIKCPVCNAHYIKSKEVIFCLTCNSYLGFNENQEVKLLKMGKNTKLYFMGITLYYMSLCGVAYIFGLTIGEKAYDFFSSGIVLIANPFISIIAEIKWRRDNYTFLILYKILTGQLRYQELQLKERYTFQLSMLLIIIGIAVVLFSLIR